MSVRSALSKMFGYARETHDEFGKPIPKKTIEEYLLEKHLERERKKKIKAALKHYEKKHWNEMTKVELPYHKKARLLNRKKKRR